MFIRLMGGQSAPCVESLLTVTAGIVQSTDMKLGVVEKIDSFGGSFATLFTFPTPIFFNDKVLQLLHCLLMSVSQLILL